MSLASANVMTSDFAATLKGPQSHTLLGVQQSIMLGEMAVNRVLIILIRLSHHFRPTTKNHKPAIVLMPIAGLWFAAFSL